MTVDQIHTNSYNQPLAAGGTAVNAAKAAGSDFSSLLQNAVNPGANRQTTDMDEIFERASKQYGIPVNLLKAVAKTESGFDPGAVSSCGAQGVMQLMPSTAKSMGVQNPLDAEQNIMAGARYLSQKISQYGGNVTLALAAYNAGSGNVAKYNGVPPFKETQAYISRVMDYAGLSLDAPEEPLSSLDGSDAPDSSGLPGSLNSFSALSALLGSSSLPALGDLSSLSSQTGTSAASGAYTYEDYLSFLQLMIAQMQTSSTQEMSSDLTGLTNETSGSGMML